MSILIKNGLLITGAGESRADLFIEGEKISAIGENLQVKADQVIDAGGLLVLPGGIDPHVHLDMPFMGTFSSDNYETGTRAALHGGTTMVIDFILQTQGNRFSLPWMNGAVVQTAIVWAITASTWQ
jgi:dihydropyrimidinase